MYNAVLIFRTSAMSRKKGPFGINVDVQILLTFRNRAMSRNVSTVYQSSAPKYKDGLESILMDKRSLHLGSK